MDLLYAPEDLAAIMRAVELEYNEQVRMLNAIYTYDRFYMHQKHLVDKELFISEALECLANIGPEVIINRDYPKINEDIIEMDMEIRNRNVVIRDDQDVALFFKYVRIRLLYLQDYLPEGGNLTFEISDMLRAYGYDALTDDVRDSLEECMAFFHIHAYLELGAECEISDMEMDDVITLRVE
ncbi:MAG: hypothetical protein J5825_12290 [Lachnospiraceae bacterium]|nr:hypothetical protein [Lachnospiraceae bacterium]